PAPTSVPAKTYANKRKQATGTTDKPAKAKRIKRSASRKTHQPRSSPKSVGESKAEEVPAEEFQVADEDADFQKAAGPDPNAQVEGQTGSDTNREHMDLDVANVSPQPSIEQLYKGFTATVYPNVQENIKLAVEEPVLLEEPASSSGTLSSLQHLSRDFSFGDQFFREKPSDADKSAETEVESIVNVPIQQALSSITLMTSPIIDLTSRPELDKRGARLYTLEQLDIPQQVSIAVSEVVTDAVDWAMQAPLRNRFRDLPKADMKEILNQCMWESDSYKSHEDHMQLFEALEKSINHDHSEELAHDLAEAQKKRKKAGPSGTSGAPRASRSQVTPPPPPPTSTNQDSPSKGSAAPSLAKTAATTKHQAWSTPDVMLKPLVSLTPEDLDVDEAMGLDEQAQLSDEEDIGSAHIPTRPTTPKPAWSIRSSDVPIPTNNWASTLASNYSPPPEDSLLVQTGDITTFMDWFHKRRGLTELKPQDLEGPAYDIVKAQRQQTTATGGSTWSSHNPIRLLLQQRSGISSSTLSISKMKATYYPDAGLEQMVPYQFWIEEECKYDIAAMYGISHWWFQRQRFYIDRHTSKGDRDYMKKIVLRRADLNEHVIAERDFKQLVIRQRVEDFQLGIESYQTQDKYGVQMMMRFNEIHKFSDRTLQQIVEALDYRVKEFRIKRMNPGLNTRFWTRKDVDRCNAFMFAIKRRLRTWRVFRNLESFVGGRVREGDYRLLRHTD
nr:hypothetical protein [Tanacetum cinerariifolium]